MSAYTHEGSDVDPMVFRETLHTPPDTLPEVGRLCINSRIKARAVIMSYNRRDRLRAVAGIDTAMAAMSSPF